MTSEGNHFVMLSKPVCCLEKASIPEEKEPEKQKKI